MHAERHPRYVEGCFACRVRSVGVIGAGTREVNARDAQLARDRDAYKRLRDDGLRPRSVDGSHDLEAKVNSQFDIDLGHVIPKGEESRVREGMDLVREMGPA